MALPKNAHVSTHPCLQAKLSQLRSASTGCRDAQTLVHEIALMVGYEALGSALKAQEAGTVRYVRNTQPHSRGCQSVGKAPALSPRNATQEHHHTKTTTTQQTPY
jgi:hypothetical protein